MRLSRQADASGGADAIALRTEALALVRGRPFEDVLDDGFEWVEAEHLDSQMAGVIATCAVRLASDHLEAKDFAAATEAAWAGRRGAPEDSGPWLVGAQAIWAQGDRSALRRWMTDASRHLDPEDIARIERSLPAAHDSSSSVGEGEVAQGGFDPAALHAHGVVAALEDLGHLGQGPSLDTGLGHDDDLLGGHHAGGGRGGRAVRASARGGRRRASATSRCSGSGTVSSSVRRRCPASRRTSVQMALARALGESGLDEDGADRAGPRPPPRRR